MTLLDISHKIDCHFHGIDYLLHIYTYQRETLEIEIEQKSDASIWKGHFTSKYIEEITSKTGNFKKYDIFLKMLVSALKGTSHSVFLDLLTYNDLENLKNTKLQKSNKNVLLSAIAPSNKRYLILTYASEFDRVHYPLPLSFEEHPDPERLKEIITDLRNTIETLRNNNINIKSNVDVNNEIYEELEKTKSENLTLRKKINNLKNSDGHERELRLLRKERDVLHSRLESVQMDLEREKGRSQRELNKLVRQMEAMETELNTSREELRREKIRNKDFNRQERHLKKPSISSLYNNNRKIQENIKKPDPKGYMSSGGSSIRSVNSRGRSNRSLPRFDPTAYVKNKKEMQNRRKERKGQQPPPPPPRLPISSRESSIGRGSVRSKCSKKSNISKKSISSVDASPYSSKFSTPKKNSSSNNKKDDLNYKNEENGEIENTEISPSVALQNVKLKLKEFSKKQQLNQDEEDIKREFQNNDCIRENINSEDIEDVDHRLAALQNFLKMARETISS